MPDIDPDDDLTGSQTDPDVDPDADVDPAGADALGEPGKRALDAMKSERNAARAELARTKAELAALKPKPAPKAAADKGDAAFDAEAFRNELRAETLREKVADKLEAKAARLLADPADAALYLGGRMDEFIHDGRVDTAALDAALAELVKDKPYLAAAQGDAKPRFAGSGDGGPKGNAGKPQLTRADVEKMSAEGKTAEIVAARKAGQLDKLLGIKTPA